MVWAHVNGPGTCFHIEVIPKPLPAVTKTKKFIKPCATSSSSKQPMKKMGLHMHD